VSETTASRLPPWLDKAAAQLQRAHANQRMPHALLLHEAPGAGGELFATWAAQLLLCTGATPACGQCRSCQRVARNEHPDYRIIVPDPELKLGQITVDQVRDLGAGLALSSHEGAGTCVLIKPAHALNRFSANALLKTLEEPRPGVLLILLTSSPSLLPATLRSRCLRLRLPAPDRESALVWLQAQRPARHGRPRWMCWALRRWRPWDPIWNSSRVSAPTCWQYCRMPGRGGWTWCARQRTGLRMTWACDCAALRTASQGGSCTPRVRALERLNCVLARSCKRAVWT
jgi:DNA polymerase III delta' subunit